MNKGYSVVQSLNLKQSTILAPQLQQGIRLLALSSMELQNEIDQALDSNPFLEKLDYETGIEARSALNEQLSEPLAVHARRATDSPLIHGYTPAQPVGSVAKQGSTAGLRADQAFSDASDFELEQAREQSLGEYLHQQARGTPLSDKQHHILTLLIDSVNDNGYLRATAEEIVGFAMPDYVITQVEVLAMIRILQDFEPVGVGARTPRECLTIQLKDWPEDTPGLYIARQIVKQYLPLLAKKEYARIAAELTLSQQQLRVPIELIRKLNPFPGASISRRQETTIAADLLVKKIDDKWVVRLNPNVAPSIIIHDESAQLLKLAKGQKGYERMKAALQTAQGLLSNIQRRYHTIYRVAKIVVERQTDFLEQGQIALQPLSQKTIAEILDIHVSTVSRAVNGKYILTPFGVLELRYFFSSSVPGQGGQATSSRALQSLIKKMIDAESPDKPLSDNKLTEALKQQGYQIARRTVMKYREQIDIPASPQRRKLKQGAKQ